MFSKQMRGSLTLPALFAASLSTVACGAQPNSPGPESAASLDPVDEAPAESVPAPSEDVISQAARPFTGYRPHDKKALDAEALFTFLAAADAICIGERHDQPLDHYAEHRALSGFVDRRAMRGFELGLGMEMVRDAEQPTLRAYNEGRIDDGEFESLSRWGKEWGFPIQYYRPQLQLAREKGVELLALGVERALTRSIAEVGIAGLPQEARGQLPELDRSSVEHRELFDALMSGHPTEKEALDQYYEAQLVWDEAMAERSAAWLSARSPGRKLLIFAGTAHCHRTAIPARLARRTGLVVVNLLPVVGGAPIAVAASPQTTDERLTAGYDYQMVFNQ